MRKKNSLYMPPLSEYQKRTTDLVKICSLLAKQNVPFHLDIIGNGDAKNLLVQKCKEAYLDEYVTFRGWLSQKEVAGSLSATDILVLTSDFEGTPIAMMEPSPQAAGLWARG
jgi:glycosyltransferase involved in cell wall biosynthesis